MKIKKEDVYKTTPTKDPVEDLFSNKPLQLDPELKKELEEQGLVPRWMSVKLLEQNGGFHKRGWRPYKRISKDNTPFSELFGKNADGYVRRNDMILGVKTKEEVEAHKRYLAQENDRVRTDRLVKSSRNEMQDYLRATGQENMRTVESYD